MKTTEKISIGGFPFTIEQDAYVVLDQYIKDIAHAYRNDVSSEEIVSAIEERIAELILEKSGKGAVVTLSVVEMVKERIGDPAILANDEKENAAPSGTPGQESKARQQSKQAKRLYRDLEHRIAGGICCGIAAYFNIDVIFPRLIMALMFIAGFFTDGHFFFITAVAYIILWIIIPPAKTVEERCRLAGKPLGLDEFKDKANNPATIREIGNEARTAPALKTAGRVLGIILGAILMIAGISGIAGSVCTYIIGPDTIQHIADKYQPDGIDDSTEFMLHFLTNKTVWLMIISIIAIFSLLLLYSGTLLAFNFRSPKWKPGLILLLLWFLILIIFVSYTAREAILFFT